MNSTKVLTVLVLGLLFSQQSMGASKEASCVANKLFSELKIEKLVGSKLRYIAEISDGEFYDACYVSGAYRDSVKFSFHAKASSYEKRNYRSSRRKNSPYMVKLNSLTLALSCVLRDYRYDNEYRFPHQIKNALHKKVLPACGLQ